MNKEPCTVDDCPYHNALFTYCCELDKSANCEVLNPEKCISLPDAEKNVGTIKVDY